MKNLLTTSSYIMSAAYLNWNGVLSLLGAFYPLPSSFWSSKDHLFGGSFPKRACDFENGTPTNSMGHMEGKDKTIVKGAHQ